MLCPVCKGRGEAVMAAQTDLVEPVYALKQFICVKGASEDTRRR